MDRERERERGGELLNHIHCNYQTHKWWLGKEKEDREKPIKYMSIVVIVEIMQAKTLIHISSIYSLIHSLTHLFAGSLLSTN